jgi:hypothetical protein
LPSLLQAQVAERSGLGSIQDGQPALPAVPSHASPSSGASYSGNTQVPALIHLTANPASDPAANHQVSLLTSGRAPAAQSVPIARSTPSYSSMPPQTTSAPHYMPSSNLPVPQYAHAGHTFTNGQPRTSATYNMSFHTSHPQPAQSSLRTNNLVKESSRSPVLQSHVALTFDQSQSA